MIVSRLSLLLNLNKSKTYLSGLNITPNYDHSNYEGYIACEETHKDLQIYCKKFDCSGVIIRPDKYVFDLFNFNKSDSLETIINDVLINIREKIEFN